MGSPSLSGIYPLLDADFLRARGLDMVTEARKLLQASPGLIQLRAKSLSISDYRAMLEALLPDFRAARTQLFVNDEVDLALAVGADGVHVGQGDASVAEVRARGKPLLVGVSTHNQAQFAQALLSKPDYLALGPIFPTQSKKNPEPTVGLPLLRELSAQARLAKIPLVAIGGIDASNLNEVAPHVEAIAFISALYAQPQAEDCAQAYEQLLAQTHLGA